jgi:hypothetical protein
MNQSDLNNMHLDEVYPIEYKVYNGRHQMFNGKPYKLMWKNCGAKFDAHGSLIILGWRKIVYNHPYNWDGPVKINKERPKKLKARGRKTEFFNKVSFDIEVNDYEEVTDSSFVEFYKMFENHRHEFMNQQNYDV